MCVAVPAALCVVLSNAAKQVTACDFMAVSIEENKRQHAALGNVDFEVADVTEMEQVLLGTGGRLDPVQTAIMVVGVLHRLPGHMWQPAGRAGWENSFSMLAAEAAAAEVTVTAAAKRAP